MHIERLKHMTKLLRSIPPQNFNLTDWTEADEGIVDTQQAIECGTVCCAVGWACSDPWFIEQGLHWGSYTRPVFGEYCSWSAVEEFFELTEADARHLFDSDCYRTATVKPNTVANRIYSLIRKNS